MKTRLALILTALTLAALPAAGQSTQPAGSLTVRTQERIRDEFQKLMRHMLEVADQLAATDAESAQTIRQAVQQAQRAFIAEDMSKVIELLGRGMVHPADATQAEVIRELKAMLETLRSGSIELDERWKQIEQWKTHLGNVDRLLERERRHARDSLVASQGAAMAERLGELGEQLARLVERQKTLLGETGALPAPDPAAARLAAIRDALQAVRDDQANMATATAALVIAQLPAAEQKQKDLAAQLADPAAKLDAVTGLDEQSAAAVGRARQAVAQSRREMSASADELAKSNKTTALERQRQAAADLDAAIAALDETLRSVSAGSAAGELAGRQGGLGNETAQLARDVQQALDQAAAGEDGTASQPSGNLAQAAQAMAQAGRRLNAQQKDPAAQAQREALRQMEDDLARLAELQRRLEEQAADPDLDGQRRRQDETAERTTELADEMNSQSPSGGSATPGQEAVSNASQSMGQASQSLSQGQSGQANQQQQQAVEQLEQARQALMQAIAEQEQLAQADALIRIESMLRVILQTQLSVNARTVAVFAKRTGEQYDRPEQLELAELANTQGRQAEEVRKLHALLRKEGTTAVFPSVLEQTAADMSSVQELLAKREAGLLTQGVQEQIAQTLSELIEALEREIRRREQEVPPPLPEAGQPGPAAPPPLVPPVAELKMLRTLQQHIHDRTATLDGQVRDGQVDPTAARLQHKLLSDRQARLADLTRELAQRMRRGGGEGGGR